MRICPCAAIILTFFAFYASGEGDIKERRAILEDAGFKKLRSDLTVCLDRKSESCLLALTYTTDPEGFAIVPTRFGEEEIECSPPSVNMNFTPEVIFRCLFKPGGASVLKQFRAGLREMDVNQTSLGDDREPDGKTVKIFSVTPKSHHITVQFQKVKGAWRLQRLNSTVP